jgi:hypothetical protein
MWEEKRGLLVCRFSPPLPGYSDLSEVNGGQDEGLHDTRHGGSPFRG